MTTQPAPPKPPRGIAGSFWFLPIGLACAVATLFEGSFIWALFGVVSAWIGVTSGLASGDKILEAVRGQIATGQRAGVAGMFSLAMVLNFWLPQAIYIAFGMTLAKSLQKELTPRSLESFPPLVLLESLTLYFCSIGAAWYKAWRWVRAPQ